MVNNTQCLGMKVRQRIFLIMEHTLKEKKRSMNKIMMMINMTIKRNKKIMKSRIRNIKKIKNKNKNMKMIMNKNKDKMIIRMNKNMSKILNENSYVTYSQQQTIKCISRSCFVTNKYFNFCFLALTNSSYLKFNLPCFLGLEQYFSLFNLYILFILHLIFQHQMV